ncbi:MAG: hypothetical protein ABSH33_05340 [Steroidobacteraceae bacterium]|jgi:hypothetical protein
MNTHTLRQFGETASTTLDSRSLEAQIADCCHAIYWATEPEIAMTYWLRLRKLTAQRSEAEEMQYLRETMNAALPPRL